MWVQTTMWGEVEISESKIYNFLKGIPGFEDEHQFALIQEENSSFVYLQSLKQAHLTFLLTDPFIFYPNYEFDLPDNEVEELNIQDELFVRCIVTIKENVKESSLNLLAPLVFNPKQKSGKQIILHQSSYRTNHQLWLGDDSNEKDGE